ncbi:tyrosine-type recombinase/integrase [Acinetobacter sp. ME22]|uniref:tyrosine-type recombinase/integrase n=1 Tax=Acinetobacter sp. ME22 TaxID=2904802 RepID=UPI001EDC6DF5|nr:tyrosine-type recombinase/integrase [Acinetobacter sp. ME22]MCG2574199.1 tyrosine-type recombinase/integrase [Acinetobacter sp. ME22]
MGTITKRTTSKGEIRYRALIQVRKQDINFNESRTFSKKALAEAWLKKREAEIEENPDILLGKNSTAMILADAIDQYLDEINEAVGTSKRYKLKFFKQFPFCQRRIDQLSREDFAQYILQRRAGIPEMGLDPIAKSTADQEIQYLRSVLNHAELLWNQPSVVKELEQAARGLRNARQIAGSATRSRLPTREELQTLTSYFYDRWVNTNTTMPLHLIMWLAIYTSRRRGELFGLRLEDYDPEHGVWLVRNIKNPNGAQGNNKRFKVSEKAKQIIDQLLDPTVRKKMMRLTDDDSLLIPLDAGAVTRVFTNACRLYGIEDLWWHDLRHEAATRLAEQGLTIPQIQQYTLHDSWSSLERYVNLDLIRKNVLDFDQAVVNAIEHSNS